MPLLAKDHVPFIYKTLEDKKKKLPFFSLRYLAKKISISPASLCEYMKGKRSLPENTVTQIAHKLDLPPLDTADILAGNVVEREVPQSDHFKLFAEWEYLAVLHLVAVPSFSAQAAWLAERLAISAERADAVFKQLVQWGYVFEVDGKWQRTPKKLHSSDNVTSAMVRACHEDDLKMIESALHKYPATIRDSSSMTFLLAKDNFEKAQVLIRKLRVELDRLAKAPSENEAEVYKFITHLIPLSAAPAKAEEIV